MDVTLKIVPRALSAMKGIAVLCLWYGVMVFAVVSAAAANAQNYLNTVGATTAAMVMLVLAYLTRSSSTWAPLGMSFSRRQWLLGTIAVVSIYLIVLAWRIMVGQPKEPFMETLYLGYSPIQACLFTLAVVISAPIGEEIALRHFLMGGLAGRKRLGTPVTLLLTALVFFALHYQQYEYWSTHFCMFLLAVVFGVARIFSKSITLPIVLHAQAGAVALFVNHIT